MLLDLRRRAVEPELLDLGVPEAEARRSLADLRFVNRWLGGQRALLRGVLPLLPERGAARLLDVGCGSADLPALLAARLPRLHVVGVDIKPAHLRAAPATILKVVADLRNLPFRPKSFDVVTASLVLHHFPTGDLPEILASLFALARGALVVNDLRRARVPYVFGRLVFPLVFRSQVSVQDGLISIRSGFTDAELSGAFDRADIPDVRLVHLFPYRLVAIARRAP